MIARHSGLCQLCQQSIRVGDEIARHQDRNAEWAHNRCLPVSSRFQKAGWRVEVVASNAPEYRVGEGTNYVHKLVAESTRESRQSLADRAGYDVRFAVIAL